MLAALGPTGCGFRPLYGKVDASDSPEAAELATVRVMGIPDRQGQQLRTNLIQRLTPRGEPAQPRYHLTVTLSETLEGLAESKDGKATVGRLYANVGYVLNDARTGKQVVSGTTRSITSMRSLGPRYASVVTERENEDNALVDAADQIRNALAVHFANSRQPTRP